jgi:hypothetical protein
MIPYKLISIVPLETVVSLLNSTLQLIVTDSYINAQ